MATYLSMKKVNSDKCISFAHLPYIMLYAMCLCEVVYIFMVPVPHIHHGVIDFYTGAYVPFPVLSGFHFFSYFFCLFFVFNFFFDLFCFCFFSFHLLVLKEGPNGYIEAYNAGRELHYNGGRELP